MTDLKLMRGDDTSLRTYVYRHNPSTGLDDPITAQTAWFTAKRNARDADDEAVIFINSDDTPDKVQISSGQVVINLSSQDMAIYTDRLLLYDVQIMESTGLITTVEKGILQLIGDITRQVVITPGETYLTQDAADARYSQITHEHVELVNFFFTFKTGTAAGDPGTGNFRLNNTTMSAVTQLYLDIVDNTGNDISNWFELVRNGDLVRVRNQADASQYAHYIASSPPSRSAVTGWWQLDVTFDSESGTFSPTNNMNCVIAFARAAHNP